MKAVFITCIFATTAIVSAAEPPAGVAEFFAGKRATFTTKGHAHADGIVVSVEYPASWKIVDRSSPTLQFLSSIEPNDAGRPVTLNVGISDDDGLTPKDAAYVPEGAKLISKQRITISGRQGNLAEYTSEFDLSRSSKEPEKRQYQHAIAIEFREQRKVISIFLPVNGPASKREELEKLFDEYSPLFQAMIGTVKVGG